MQAESEATSGDEPGRPEWLAGYRLLRRLGSGSRASVYLGKSGDAAEGVAVKVFDAVADSDGLDSEIDALSAVSSPYVVRMLDIAIAAGRPPCLVLQRLTGGSLAALLARETELTAGAAVTVLVSVARGLAALHAAGFDHEHVAPTTVLFDGAGRPVLIGLGHAVRIGRREPGPSRPGGPSTVRRSAGAAGLARLTRTVFDRVDDPAARKRAEELAHWLEQGGTDASTWAGFEDRLFDVAEPEPVLHDDRDLPTRPDGAGGGDQPLAVRGVLGRLRVPAEPAGRRGAAHAAARDGPPWWAGVETARRAVLSAVRQRRRPLVVAAAAGGALLVLALTVLPVNGRDGGGAAPAGRPTASIRPSHDVASTGALARTPSGAPRSPAVRQPPAAGIAAIRGDEPVAATDALLALRRACLSTASPTCLTSVDQDGSPLLQADRSLVATHAAVERYEGYETSLIQRSGGSALIALTPPKAAETPKPASALVIEGETGWRLREVFAD